MKWVVIAVGALFLLVALAAVLGSLLPSGHVAKVRARFRAAPAAVYAVITDFAKFPEWRSDVKRVEILPARDGREAYREIGRHGRITYEVVEAAPPARFSARIADEDLAFGGSWTFSLEEDGGGTRVTVVEDGVIHNPIFRCLSKYVFGQTGTMVAYLRALGRRLGEETAPEAIREA
jgi:uncharacterized protein YndB with AHSA1/START domain